MKLITNLGGVAVDSTDPKIARLARAILISLFTWRRAEASDGVPLTDRRGWWGDAFADRQGDRIGSRLWLLERASLTQQTINDAQDYANEALAWMIEDGVAARVDVTAERIDSGLALRVVVQRPDGGQLELLVSEFWGELNV